MLQQSVLCTSHREMFDKTKRGIGPKVLLINNRTELILTHLETNFKCDSFKFYTTIFVGRQEEKPHHFVKGFKTSLNCNYYRFAIGRYQLQDKKVSL